MSSNLRTGLLASCALATIQLMGASTASAQGYCSVASEAGLSLGCVQPLVDASILNGVLNPANALINPIIGSHDGLVFDSDWIANSASDGQLRFEGSVKFARGLNSSWANTYFGSARTDGGKTTYDVTAFDVRDINTGNIIVELQFDRLTLENSALTLRDGASSTGRQTGEISFLEIGDGAIGRGGVLALRNASLTFANDTDLFMAAPPGGTPVIRAETGDNLLQLGNQSTNLNRLSVVVDDGAALTFDGTAISTRTEGNLTVGSGADLTIENNSVLGLLSNVGSGLPQSTVNGGTVTVDGLSSELRLTAPVFNNSTVSLENGGTLRIEQRNGVRSTLSFSGDSTLNFGSEQDAVLGAVANPQAMILAVGAGTTKITNTGGVNNVGRGLQVDQVRIDGGTLDTSGYSVRDDVTNAWLYLSVENGGTFYDQFAFYRNIDRLIVDGGTLQTNSSFGDFVGAADGIENALFTNSTIDLVSASSAGTDSGNVSVGLRSVVLNAQNLEFAGTNQVTVGISPAGECVAGICTPALTRYAGNLVANVGGSPTSTLTGFDTVMFVPFAIDANAVAADYIAGGNNGIYTVAIANNNPRLTFNVQSFDAAPMTPTATQLSAARSDLPANLVYTIVNNPVADDRVDISFVDIGLLNHPLIATGTGNTMSYGSLVVNSKGTLTHADLLQVQTLHPEAYASYMTVALEHSDHLRNMVLANARGNAAGGDRVEGVTDSGSGIWLDSSLMRGNVDSNGGLAGFSYDLGEVVLGGDLWSNETANIGAYVGYGQYSMGEHTSSTSSLSFASKAYHVGAYGTHDSANWSMTGMAGFSWANTESTREAVTGSTSNIHNADYASRTFEAAVRAEYLGFKSGGAWQFVPEIGLGYARYTQDAITETGASDTALTIKDATAESLIGSIGINVTGPEFGGGLKPLAFLRYEHDFLASRDNVHEIDAAFASSPGTSQTFIGTHRGPDAISIGFGLSSAAGSSADVSAGLVYTKNTYGDEFGGGLSITWAF
ncbi:autotransporter family protein [Sedimentitalea todarodis]|uniref:Autotransporter outer membrane beta-barrel domain-containing protein n=1 Tax=Sedimentitalea todarodis TaxID=1631240 RepID=A0ABU3VLR0_9RHOB|nr:autotransporter outer membrane beta-barrel domain-containing protein [Sedimentitalea todarodis]MDU9007113.1 autotransporter outer membrane beta-barrel domain-containing protein [Sedimentitalea todarodis]